MVVEIRDRQEWRRVRCFDAATVNDLSQGECRDIAELLRLHRDVRLVHDSGRVLAHYGAEEQEGEP